MATGRNKSRSGFFSILFGVTARTAMLTTAGVLVLSYLSMYVNPAKAWFMTVFGLLYLPLFIINFVLLLWALRRRSRAVIIPVAVLLPSLLLISRYVQFASPSEDTADLKVVSYNVGKFHQSSRIADEKTCADSVYAFLRRTDADIICLQEVHTTDAATLRQQLSTAMEGYGSEYYIYVDDHGAYGNVTLSRYPVRAKGKFDFEHSSNLAIYTDIDMGDRTVRVYNCHFESYNISIPGLIKAFAHSDDEAVGRAEQKIRSSITRRPQQVGRVMEDIRESPVLSFVTGDFNDTPVSYTYTQLKRGHSDSFVEAGRGMGGTYSVLWPFIRIDYVLYPEGFKAISHKVGKVKYSDHYPIITEFKKL